MVDATQTTNTNDDLEDLTGRVSELERRLAIHNHADPYSQPIWVGNSSQGTANIVKPPSTGVMGENCSNGDALGFGASNITISQPNSNATFLLGIDNYGGYCQEKILSTIPGTLVSFSFVMAPTSSYTYTIVTDMYSDNAGSPGDNLFHYSGSYYIWNNDVTVTVNPNVAVQANTNYWFKITVPSGQNFSVPIYYNSGNNYNNSFYAHNDKPTTVNGGDLRFSVIIAKDSTKLFRSSANTTAELASYVGISNKSCKQGETADITTWGFKNDYSNLTVGAPYYLTDAAGVIGTSPGTNSKQIGIGFSPTTLLIGYH